MKGNTVPALYRAARPAREPRRRGQGGAAGAHRAHVPRARPARDAGHGEPRRRIRGDPAGALRRRAGGRCATAGAAFRAGHRRGERPARTGFRGRRGAFRLRLLHGRDTRVVRARCGRPGARESRRASRARRHHDRRAGARLAGRAAARGDRSRARGRLQSQGQLCVLRPHRRARGGAGRDASSTTAPCRTVAGRFPSTTRGIPPSAPC